MKKRIIWSNRDINPEDWIDGYKETAEENGWDEDTDDENNLWRFIHESLDQYLDDARMNLNIPTDGRILVIEDLGLWYGRRQCYKISDNKNVNEIFGTHYDYTEWYSDGYNIKAIDVHHDGVNYYEFREIREDRFNSLLDAIYSGKKITRRMLNYYTRSLHGRVAKVYGW
jgi:hypothetical protein